MKTKKYLLAIAIFGGVLFTVHAATTYSQTDGNDKETSDRRGIKLKKRPITTWG